MFRNTILLVNFYHFSFACMKLFYIFAVYSKNVKPHLVCLGSKSI